MPNSMWIWLSVLGLSTLVGFVTVAPMGPVNLLCARRTLRHGFWPGFSAAIGAIGGEAIHAAIAVKGLLLVSDSLRHHAETLRPVAGAALLVAAVASWRSADVPPDSVEPGEPSSARAPRMVPAVAAAFVLAASNPVQFVTMGIGLAAVRHVAQTSPRPSAELAGLVLGSSLWWIVLTSSLARARRRFGAETLRRVNRSIAVALGAIAVAILFGL